MQVTVQIPDQFLEALIPGGTDPARVLLEQTVAAAYRERRVGPETVRILLDLPTSVETLSFLQRHHLWGYTVQDLDSDLATLDSLREKYEAEKAA